MTHHPNDETLPHSGDEADDGVSEGDASRANPPDRRELLARLAGMTFLTAGIIRLGVPAQAFTTGQTGGDPPCPGTDPTTPYGDQDCSPNPSTTDSDCGVPYAEGGYVIDNDCEPGRHDKDCGKASPGGGKHEDNDCTVQSLQDSDCGKAKAGGGTHQDNDCKTGAGAQRDNDCGLLTGTGSPKHQDSDCEIGGSDSDCGSTQAELGSLNFGHSDNDCHEANAESLGSADQDCGVQSNDYGTLQIGAWSDNWCVTGLHDLDCGVLAPAYAAHEDADCGQGATDDHDCGKPNGGGGTWADSDCPQPSGGAGDDQTTPTPPEPPTTPS